MQVPIWERWANGQGKKIRLTEFSYDQHTLLEASNRFSSCKQWIFARYKQSCCRCANTVAYVADKVGDKAPNLSDLYAASKHAENGVHRKRLDTDVEKLLQKLSSFGGSMKTTHYHIKRARRHLMARLASPEMTSPTWFITLSSADLYWPELWVAIAASKGQSLSFESAGQISYSDRCKLLDDNPALACRLFKARVECMLKDIFCGEAHPIGYLVDWWFRVEFQNRGSLHVHAILWALLHYKGTWYDGDELTDMMTKKSNPVVKPTSSEIFGTKVTNEPSPSSDGRANVAIPATANVCGHDDVIIANYIDCLSAKESGTLDANPDQLSDAEIDEKGERERDEIQPQSMQTVSDIESKTAIDNTGTFLGKTELAEIISQYMVANMPSLWLAYLQCVSCFLNGP